MGDVNYEISCDPFTNWESDLHGPNRNEYDSDSSDESTGQNYPSYFSSMKPLHILAWNVRGAASSDFRRAFMELMGKHKPNVVLLTETRIGGDRATSIINSLGFSHHCKVDPMGYVWGLCLLWNGDDIKMHIHGQTFQEIYAIAEVSHNTYALLTFVYGSPIRERRKFLWKNLINISSSVNIPWLICGDFNDVLCSAEKWGVRDVCKSRIDDFNHVVNSCGLLDLGYSGPKFTWVNKRDNGSLVMERLDRFLANAEWLSIFPESVVSHLPRTKSDHNPILLNTIPNHQIFGRRPFRCESVWLNHSDFIQLSKNIWSSSSSSSQALESLKSEALIWNKTCFGNIFLNKNRILRRLEGTQRALSSSPNSFLVKLEKDLNVEYLNILRTEEQFWASKSRINWLNLGDSNTSYFHASILKRRRDNRISSIKDSLGDGTIKLRIFKTSYILNSLICLLQPLSLSSSLFHLSISLFYALLLIFLILSHRL